MVGFSGDRCYPAVPASITHPALDESSRVRMLTEHERPSLRQESILQMPTSTLTALNTRKMGRPTRFERSQIVGACSRQHCCSVRFGTAPSPSVLYGQWSSYAIFTVTCHRALPNIDGITLSLSFGNWDAFDERHDPRDCTYSNGTSKYSFPMYNKA